RKWRLWRTFTEPARLVPVTTKCTPPADSCWRGTLPALRLPATSSTPSTSAVAPGGSTSVVDAAYTSSTTSTIGETIAASVKSSLTLPALLWTVSFWGTGHEPVRLSDEATVRNSEITAGPGPDGSPARNGSISPYRR